MRINLATTRGHSLFELLITLLIVALLLSLGLPAFDKIAARNRQHAEISVLFHAIHLARKESIMRKRVVSLCPSNDGLTCTPGRDWSAGWIMFDNRDRDDPPEVDPGEAILQAREALPGMRLTANRRGFTLRATFLRATNGTLVVCDDAGRIPAKALIVSYTGRPRVAFENTRGDPYDCAD